MAFQQEVLQMMRVKLAPDNNGVLVQRDRFGNCESLNAIPPGKAISAQWLPNEEIEVVVGDPRTGEGEIRHYTSINEYYNAGYTY